MTSDLQGRLGELTRSCWDAVVVGAGPAGAMTALELARRGAGVLLVERAVFPRWKVCGSCLGPGTQELLRAAGLDRLLSGSGAAVLHTLRLGGWGSRADVPLGAPVALSRAALDRALVASAVEAGATLAAPVRARVGPCRSGVRRVTLQAAGDMVEVEARVVVAADGLGGQALADGRGEPSARVEPGAPIGFGALFPVATSGFEAGVIHMAVGSEGYVGAVRLEDGTLDVAAALGPARDPPRNLARTGGDGEGAPGAGRRAGSEIHPERAISRLLEGAGFPGLSHPPLAGWKGTPRLTRAVSRRGAERLFAVGDAAGYVEPFTGEGIGWAMAGARSLFPIALEAIRGWDPALVDAWDREYQSTVGAQARLCRGLAWALRRPALSRAGLGLLRHAPGAARPLVRWAGRAAVHTHGRNP